MLGKTLMMNKEFAGGKRRASRLNGDQLELKGLWQKVAAPKPDEKFPEGGKGNKKMKEQLQLPPGSSPNKIDSAFRTKSGLQIGIQAKKNSKQTDQNQKNSQKQQKAKISEDLNSKATIPKKIELVKGSQPVVNNTLTLRQRQMDKNRELDRAQNSQSITPHGKQKVLDKFEGSSADLENQEKEHQEIKQLTETTPVVHSLKDGLMQKCPIFKKMKENLVRLAKQRNLKFMKQNEEHKTSYSDMSSYRSSDSERRAAKKTNCENQKKMKEKHNLAQTASQSGSMTRKMPTQFQDWDIMNKAVRKKKLKEKMEIELTFLEKFQSCFKSNKNPDVAEVEESEELEDEDEELEDEEAEELMKFETIKLRMELNESNEMNQLRKKGILRYSDPMRERWDYFVMMLSIYNSGYLPYEQAFEKYDHCSFDNLLPIDYFNYSIDVCFALDIIINLSTTYLDPETGEERKTRKEIIQNYISSMFLIDFMATIPFYEMFCIIMRGNMSRWVQMLAILKLIRVLRLQRVITYMNTTDDVKLTLQLVKTSIYLILFIHFTACLWFYLAARDRKWIPGQTKLFGEMGANLYTDFTPFGQLTICLYTSVLALCGNDILPMSTDQYILSSIILMLGALFNAYMFGSIAVIFQTLNKKSQKFTEQLDNANTSMKNMYLPTMIQDQVRDYLMRTQSNLDQQKELEEFLSIISPSLTFKVTQEIFKNAIKNNSIFSEKNDVIKYMLQQVQPQLTLPEMSIILKNDQPDKVYFIAKGSCDVTLLDHMKNDLVIRTIEQGELFGEVALIFSCQRTATVRSQNYSTLAFLTQKDFVELWDYSPEIFFLIREKALSYNDPWIQFKIKLLEQVYYFEPFKNNEGFIATVQFYLQDFVYQQDHIILDFDEECKNIFFIVNGCVDLEILGEDGSIKVLETLEQGDIIGQFSVLYHTKLVFRVIAKTTSVRVLTLGDDFFVEYGDKDSIEGLSEAISMAEKFEQEWGLPTCDFQKFPVNNIINMKMTIRQSLDMKLHTFKKRLIMMSKLNKYQRALFDVFVNCAMDKAISHEELVEQFKERETKKKEEELKRQIQNELEFQSQNQLFNDGSSQQLTNQVQKSNLMLNDSNNQQIGGPLDHEGNSGRSEDPLLQKNLAISIDNQHNRIKPHINRNSNRIQKQGTIQNPVKKRSLMQRSQMSEPKNQASGPLRKQLQQTAIQQTISIRSAITEEVSNENSASSQQIDTSSLTSHSSQSIVSSSMQDSDKGQDVRKEDGPPIKKTAKTKHINIIEEENEMMDDVDDQEGDIVLEESAEYTGEYYMEYDDEEDQIKVRDNGEEGISDNEEYDDEGEEYGDEGEDIGEEVTTGNPNISSSQRQNRDVDKDKDEDNGAVVRDEENQSSSLQELEASRDNRQSMVEEEESEYEAEEEGEAENTENVTEEDEDQADVDDEQIDEGDEEGQQEKKGDNPVLKDGNDEIDRLVAQINIDAQYKKKYKNQEKIKKLKLQTKSKKGKRSQISQQGTDKIKDSQLSKQRYYDTERPHLLQSKNTVQIASNSNVPESSIVIPQHSIKEQSDARKKRSVHIEEKEPSLNEDQKKDDECTEMNEKSIDYEARFLVDLLQADIRTQTDYKMTKRHDTNRENLDGFVDELEKNK